MKFTVRRRDELVGAFLLAGILFLVGALLFIGLNKRWFQRDPEFHSHFVTAEGLSTGLAIELQGFAIGRVKRVRLAEGHLAEAVFSIHREHAHRIRPGSVVDLVVQPLGFGSKLVLYPGHLAGDPLPAGSLIPSADLPVGQDLIARGAAERPRRRDEAAALLTALPGLVSELEALVQATRAMVVGIDGRLLGSDTQDGGGLLPAAEGLMLSMEQTAARAAGLAGRLEPALEELNGLLMRINGLARRMDDPRGLVPALLGDEGSAARLFRDEGALYDELLEAMTQMRAILAFFNETTPDLAVLVNEAAAALETGEKVAQGLKNHPLLRGGIAPDEPSPGTFHGFRGKGR